MFKDNVTYLIFDKYACNHNLQINLQKKFPLKKIKKKKKKKSYENYTIISGINAINYFNQNSQIFGKFQII